MACSPIPSTESSPGHLAPAAIKYIGTGWMDMGNKVPAGKLTSFKSAVTLTNQAGEVHFPFFDVERNVNGLLLTRINGNFAPDDTVYWNDTPVPVVGTPSNPVVNLTGISSAGKRP